MKGFFTSRNLTLTFLALVGIVVLIERLIVTDKEAIEKSIDVICDAAAKGDTTTLHQFISPKYKFSGLDAAGFTEYVDATLKAIHLEKASIMKLDISVNQLYATVNLRTMIHVKADSDASKGLGFEGAAMIRLRLSMEKTESGWQVLECENQGPG